MVEGKDGQLSIRRVMAWAVLAGMIRYVEIQENPDAMVMSVYAGLIAAMLALTTFQNIKDNKEPVL
jgi:hypothetical protein